MSGMFHSRVPKGKRVLVVLKSGDRFVDHWESKKGRWIEFRNRGRVAKKLIRTLTIYKGQCYE